MTTMLLVIISLDSMRICVRCFHVLAGNGHPTICMDRGAMALARQSTLFLYMVVSVVWWIKW
jgi:hypothetical protein